VTVRVTVPPVVERIPSAAARVSAPAYTEAEQVFQPPPSKRVRAEVEKYGDESKGKKKGLAPLIAVGAVTILLIAGAVGYTRLPRGTAAPKPVAAPQQTAANAPLPAAANSTAATPAPAADTTEADQQRTQSDMMKRQLNTPSRIPNDLKMLAGREAPPAAGFGASGMEGLGGGPVGNVFSGQNGPKVKAGGPSRTSISAGVAGGLLIQKTSPVYPQIAREARVSGTVVIQATISKTGVIENLRAVSGPTMLRQPALDAVKTWRYKPYLLDGEPVDVETTVSVTFSLGG
jgi:protein TonB